MATILIAEDHSDIRRLMKIYLDLAGYDVVEAKNGQEAVDLANSQEGIDLFVLDITMPRLDGFGAAEQIRQNPLYRTAPIIACSARADEYTGPDSFNEKLVKPVMEEDLLATVRKYLS